MPNEDHGQVQSTGQLTVAVLADGAGGFASGGLAARLLVADIANWISSDFSELYYSDGMTVRRKLIQRITHLFQTYGREHSLDPGELACTLIAVAVDFEGRGVVFHLGDGIILRIRGEDAPCGIVSAPENGLVPNSTYLTMNCNMLEHCRFYRLLENSPFRLIAMTDGAAAHLVELRSKEGWVYTAPCAPEPEPMLRYLEASDPADDYSFAVIQSHRTS